MNDYNFFVLTVNIWKHFETTFQENSLLTHERLDGMKILYTYIYCLDDDSFRCSHLFFQKGSFGLYECTKRNLSRSNWNDEIVRYGFEFYNHSFFNTISMSCKWSCLFPLYVCIYVCIHMSQTTNFFYNDPLCLYRYQDLLLYPSIWIEWYLKPILVCYVSHYW